MHKNIPIGIDDFGKLLAPECNYLFIDKSLFIKEILDDASEVTLITRPRRWGKTLNMSMLKHFLALDKTTSGLFDHLAIAQVDQGRYMQYQGQYPVIYISFKDIKEQHFTLALNSICGLFQALFRQHKAYLLSTGLLDQDEQELLNRYLKGTADKATLQNALLILSELLYKASQGKRVYILIDEYDTPLNYAYPHGYIDIMTEFMRNLLSAALKGNQYLKKGVMTGILRISKESMLSGLNNLKLCSVMDQPYTAHFGFSESEVSDLFSQCGFAHSLEAIRGYYNGYRMGGQLLYNPWSIMNCLDAGGILKPYWVNTADDSLLDTTFLNATSEMKGQLQKLISDEEHVITTTLLETIRFEDIPRNSTAFWNLLMAMGYLTPVHQELVHMHFRCKLAIPNAEVRQLYVSIFRHWFVERLTHTAYEAFLEDFTAGRIEIFTKKLGEYLLTYGSYHDFASESNYHTFMLGLLCSLTDDYYLYSNPEAGEGRADMILVPRRKEIDYAMILEFKREEKDRVPSETTAQEALQQIDSRQYQAFIRRYTNVSSILKIGIVFNGKQVASRYAWEQKNIE